MTKEIGDLNNTEIEFIHSMLKLHRQGTNSVLVDVSEHSKVLFPNGYSLEKYNQIVPALCKKGLIESHSDAPRDGPVLRLTKKALKALNNA